MLIYEINQSYIKKGLIKTTFKAFNKILTRITFRKVAVSLFYQFLNDNIPRFNNQQKNLIIKNIDIADIDSLAAENEKKELFKKRLLRGDYCIAAIFNGDIIGYEWFCTGNKHIEERFGYEIIIPNDTMYAYDAYIKPDYRKHGIWRQIIAFSKKLMIKHNKKNIMSFVEYDNNISFNAHKRVGFKLIKKILFIRFFSLTFSIKR